MATDLGLLAVHDDGTHRAGAGGSLVTALLNLDVKSSSRRTRKELTSRPDYWCEQDVLEYALSPGRLTLLECFLDMRIGYTTGFTLDLIVSRDLYAADALHISTFMPLEKERRVDVISDG